MSPNGNKELSRLNIPSSTASATSDKDDRDWYIIFRRPGKERGKELFCGQYDARIQEMANETMKLCRHGKCDDYKELFFITRSKEDKLTIRLAKALSEGDKICVIIKYSAGVYGNDFTLGRIPRSGFHFIQPDKYYQEKNLQAWTQGETIESRYWFPCLDDPKVKFPREIIAEASLQTDLQFLCATAEIQDRHVHASLGESRLV